MNFVNAFLGGYKSFRQILVLVLHHLELLLEPGVLDALVRQNKRVSFELFSEINGVVQITMALQLLEYIKFGFD